MESAGLGAGFDVGGIQELAAFEITIRHAVKPDAVLQSNPLERVIETLERT